jgi:hypothetical protein
MKWSALVSVLLLVLGVYAQQIYKSVDRNGRVSYSNEPAQGAATVESIAPPPAPSPEEIERAQQRYLELEARDAQREEERREQELEDQRQRQIREDLELKRRIANRKPSNVTVINQSPYYQGTDFWVGGNPPWEHPGKPHHMPGPDKPELREPSGPANAPSPRNSGSNGGFSWPGN